VISPGPARLVAVTSLCWGATFALGGCFEEEEPEVDLVPVTGSLTGMLWIQGREDERVPVVDERVQIELNAGEDRGLCFEDPVTCDGDAITDPSGRFDFGLVPAGRFTIRVDAGSAPVESETTRYYSYEAELDVRAQTEVGYDIQLGAWTKNFIFTLEETGVDPDVDFRFRAKPCGRCDYFDILDGGEGSGAVRWNDLPHDDLGVGQMSPSASVQIFADPFYFYDEACRDGCCDLGDFDAERGTLSANDWVAVSIGGLAGELGSLTSRLQYTVTEELSSVGPSVVEREIVVEWLRPLTPLPVNSCP